MSASTETKEANNNDLVPLMTDNNITYPTNQKRKPYRSLTIIFILTIFVIAVYLLIAYFVDIFPFQDDSKSTFHPGLYGKFPVHGGSIRMQQKAPNQDKIKITKENINQLSLDCIYESENGVAFMGYPTIDNNNNVYFCDMYSGYITSVNLDNNCQLRWRSHIGELLGYSNKSIIVNNYQSLTIFQDSNGDKGVLFGTPTRAYNSDLNQSCYAVALHLNNGSLWWKLKIGDGKENKNDYKCGLHGFIVDSHFAYGGVKKAESYYIDNTGRFIGRYVKIDIDTHEIVNKWNAIDDLTETQFDEYNRSYRGISSYGMSGAIIDDYLIFGTANLHDVPKYIYDCFGYALNYSSNSTYNPYLPLNKSVTKDICGNDVTHIPQWRCLDKSVHVDSLIILNKTTFQQINTIPVQGLDVFAGAKCLTDDNPGLYCPLHEQISLNCDIVPVAAYKDTNGKPFVAAINKAGRFFILDVEDGEIVITKQFSPHLVDAIFSLAIEEDSMIGITAINGMDSLLDYGSRYKLLNNITVCKTGTILAFNLSTGTVLWQMVNPYGRINESICFNDTLPWNYPGAEATTCEKGPFMSMNEYEHVKNVDVMSITNGTRVPLMSKDRARFRAPLTIVHDMVFVPSDTGDIWVLNVLNGSTIHHFTCPNAYNNSEWNRPGIKGGITVFEDRVVFYCGSYYDEYLKGNLLVSMKLDE
eukprot:444227_1